MANLRIHIFPVRYPSPKGTVKHFDRVWVGEFENCRESTNGRESDAVRVFLGVGELSGMKKAFRMKWKLDETSNGQRSTSVPINPIKSSLNARIE
jgi:hypothetical protein